MDIIGGSSDTSSGKLENNINQEEQAVNKVNRFGLSTLAAGVAHEINNPLT